nr:hypothetical protein [Tanacetum cinerariifolium]
MFKVVSKLKALKKPLRKLVYNQGNIQDRVNKLRYDLHEVQIALDKNPDNLNLRKEQAMYLYAFNEAKLDEERFLKQKSKARVTGCPNVAEAFITHYENFLGSNSTCNNINIDGLFLNKVSDLANTNMVRPITDLEIKAAMFDIGDDRAPEPDEYTSAFFKKAWDIGGLEGNILNCYGFYHSMIKWIMACVTSPSFSISINGDIHESARVIMESLKEYKSTSGLVSSIPKSTAFFGNVTNHVKMAILSIMPFSEGELPVKYLGVPLISSKLLNRDCKALVESAENRIGFYPCYSIRHRLGMTFGNLNAVNQLSSWDISRNGFHLQSHVAELVSNNGWLCPQDWLLKAPNLHLMRPPNLDENSCDTYFWCDSNADMDVVPSVLTDIASYLQPLAETRTAKIVLGKLLPAATSYYIWIEQNNRLFKDARKSSKELRDIIMVTVRLKLLTFRFKNTTNVTRLLELWKMPSIFRLYKIHLGVVLFFPSPRTMMNTNQWLSFAKIKQIVTQRVANAIETITIYETKTRVARGLMNKADKMAENDRNKGKWKGDDGGSSSQNKGHKISRAHVVGAKQQEGLC